MATVVVVSGLARSLVLFRGHLLRALVARGDTVIAMAPEAEAPDGLEALGVRYQPLPLDRAGTNPIRDLEVIARLAQRFRALQADIVLGYNVKPMVYAVLAARLARVPRRYALVTGLGYLFLPDGTLRQRVVGWVARPLYRAALQSASAVFVQNPDDERDLRSAHLLPRRARVVQLPGSGIDLAQFPASPTPEGPARVLFVGRLLKDKGVHEFVEAARRVKARHPEVTFSIVGGLDPNPSAVSAATVEGWQREGAIEYLGETRDVRPFLRGCTLFVLPSYREGTPRSVLEAMATGRAVVTTDAPGCRETVTDGHNGLLVPTRDPDALARAIGQLVEDPATCARMGAAGRAVAEERFDVTIVVSRMLQTVGP
ncbi:MAG: glycosyltransferase family 4 protein [Myxococcota bacterium]